MGVRLAITGPARNIPGVVLARPLPTAGVLGNRATVARTGGLAVTALHCHIPGIDFIASGKPTQNAFLESFNGHLGEECLNQHWFLSVEDTRDKIEAWRQVYNTLHPHSVLRCPPQAFAQRKQTELLLTRT